MALHQTIVDADEYSTVVRLVISTEANESRYAGCTDDTTGSSYWYLGTLLDYLMEQLQINNGSFLKHRCFHCLQ